MTIWEPAIAERGGPRYVAIADAIAQDVTSGVLPEGAKLPTHRDLAGRLGVTVGTVTRGYAEAERRGLTVGEVGRGTFVRTRLDPEDFGWRDAALEGKGKGVVDMSLACPWVPPDGEEGRLLARSLEQIARGLRGRARGVSLYGRRVGGSAQMPRSRCRWTLYQLPRPAARAARRFGFLIPKRV